MVRLGRLGVGRYTVVVGRRVWTGPLGVVVLELLHSVTHRLDLLGGQGDVDCKSILVYENSVSRLERINYCDLLGRAPAGPWPKAQWHRYGRLASYY